MTTNVYVVIMPGWQGLGAKALAMTKYSFQAPRGRHGRSMDDAKGGKRRSFYGWGFEEDAVGAEELGWFEKTWSHLFKVDQFDPAPMPDPKNVV